MDEQRIREIVREELQFLKREATYRAAAYALGDSDFGEVDVNKKKGPPNQGASQSIPKHG